MITIKSPAEIKIIAEGGRILAKIMKELEKRVQLGITTKELDRLAESLVLKSGARCSFKGYEGFLLVFVFQSIKKLSMLFLQREF